MKLFLSIVNLVWRLFQSRLKGQSSDFYASWRYTQKILNQFHHNSCVIHTKFIMFLTLLCDFDFFNAFFIMFLMTLMAFKSFFCNVFWRNIVHHFGFFLSLHFPASKCSKFCSDFLNNFSLVVLIKFVLTKKKVYLLVWWLIYLSKPKTFLMNKDTTTLFGSLSK